MCNEVSFAINFAIFHVCLFLVTSNGNLNHADFISSRLFSKKIGFLVVSTFWVKFFQFVCLYSFYSFYLWFLKFYNCKFYVAHGFYLLHLWLRNYSWISLMFLLLNFSFCTAIISNFHLFRKKMFFTYYTHVLEVNS